MLIDSHAHLIAEDLVRYPQASSGGEGAGASRPTPFSVERLIEAMDLCGVERAVLVHRGSVYGYDNSYVCDSAARYPERFVAVGAVDGNDPKAAEHVRYWVEERGMRGIRFMEPRKGMGLEWFDSDYAHAAWRAAGDLDIPVCMHFFRWNRLAGLRRLQYILARQPDTKVVIDHLSNMDWAVGPPDYGIDEPLRTIAALPNVFLKFTTIPLGAIAASEHAAHAVLARVIEVFGAHRIMWGSDITQSQGTYTQMVQLARGATDALPESHRVQLLRAVALQVYARGA